MVSKAVWFFFALFAITAEASAPSPVPPSPGFPACNVCGDETLRVTKLDLVLDIPGYHGITCAMVQRGGDNGFIDPLMCPAIPAVVAPCGCLEFEEGAEEEEIEEEVEEEEPEEEEVEEEEESEEEEIGEGEAGQEDGEGEGEAEIVEEAEEIKEDEGEN